MSTKPEILLVEDDEFAAEFTAMQLSGFYSLRHVADGHSALESVTQSVPDLVLLDVSMPGMDGYEVCRQIRSKAECAGIPVIFLSGKVGDEERLKGDAAGGNDFLSKPVRAEELLAGIQRLLTQKVDCELLRAGSPRAEEQGGCAAGMSTGSFRK